MPLQPYLFFGGRCDEAIAFYKQSLGAELNMRLTFDDSPEKHPPGMLPPNWGAKVMHAQVQIGDAVMLCSDGHSAEAAKFAGFSLAVSVADAADAEKKFAALSAGGRVTMPMGKTFFSPAFGMLTDKFGLGWMIMVRPAS